MTGSHPESLTLADRNDDRLKLTTAPSGSMVAKTVHAGRPGTVRVVLSLEHQVELRDYLAANLAQHGAEPAPAPETRTEAAS